LTGRIRIRIIACSIMKDELLQFQDESVTYAFLEQSLHRTPQKMPAAVQEEINKAAESDADYIVLGYGLAATGFWECAPSASPWSFPGPTTASLSFWVRWRGTGRNTKKSPGLIT